VKLRRIKTLAKRVGSLLAPGRDHYLRNVNGVVHVGANTGQERDKYKEWGLRVLWIEPIPEVFRQLKTNVAGYEGHLAIHALITDRDDATYTFNVANNGGQSSSILNLGLHKKVWPEVAFERTIELQSTTLASLFSREHVDVRNYEALILDTQGSELLVLKGAESLLHRFRFIQTEVADFESYRDGCQLRDIDPYLKARGFRERSRVKFAHRRGAGRYFDVVYEREI